MTSFYDLSITPILFWPLLGGKAKNDITTEFKKKMKSPKLKRKLFKICEYICIF